MKEHLRASAGVDLVLADARIQLDGRDSVEGWLAVKDGLVHSIGSASAPEAKRTVDCRGSWVLPGLVDIHVHFRDPGFTYKEDFLSGSLAAAHGGVTTVVDMPNTGGLVAGPKDLRQKLQHLKGRSHVDFGLYSLLVDSAPDVDELCELGVAGFKWLIGYPELHGRPAQPSTRIGLRDALQKAGEADVLVGVHAEDAGWIKALTEHLVARGRSDPRAHGDSRPPFVEALAIAEAVILGSEVGCRIHIHHLSSKLGLDVITSLRQGIGSTVTTETGPQYLYLTEANLDVLGTRGKVNPPLRRQLDVDAMWAGILSGDIQCIASDHAPHSDQEKGGPSIWDTTSGLIGVETIFPMLFHEVVNGRLSAARFVELTAEAPSKIVRLEHRKGTLLPGGDADIVIADPSGHTSISSRGLHSKYPKTPFEGVDRDGAIRSVFLRGREIVGAARPAEDPLGSYVASQYALTTARPAQAASRA